MENINIKNISLIHEVADSFDMSKCCVICTKIETKSRKLTSTERGRNTLLNVSPFIYISYH